MEKIVQEINERLDTVLTYLQDSRVKEAMQYSLLAAGKRIRPLLMLEVIRSYDMDYHPYLDIACALEMIHTYSLIHDDLPGMDNDDMRRGRKTCHKQFDEATAILAGDGLLNEAVCVILQSTIEGSLKLACLQELYSASGVNGMINGQVLDIEFENKQASLSQLEAIHHDKTGALISAAFVMGALIANPKDQDIWRTIGYKIGLAFQIQDDVLDVVSDSATLGKPVGSDQSNHKSTYVSLLGIEKAIAEANRIFDEAIALLYSMRINHGLVLGVIEMLRKRVK